MVKRKENAMRLNRSTIVIVFGSLVCCAAASSAAAVGRPVNVLENGGFEEGLAGWTPDAEHELVTGATQAHSGEKCLTGEVTQSNRALRLKQEVPVERGNRYRFEVWARATNRTKLVLFIYQPGSRERQMVAAWRAVPAGWQRYSVPIAVHAGGRLTLELIAPSSFGEPPGQIWVDDAALYETEMPPVASVSGNEGFNDEPAMARADDGSVYVAFNSFREGADSLQLARLKPNAGGFEPLGSWQLLGGKGTYLLGPRVVAAGEKVFVLYAAEVEKNWDVYAVECGAGGPGKPIRVTSGAAAEIKPAAASDGKTLWVAWEANTDGGRRIVATAVRDGQPAGPETPVSPADIAAYGPSVAVLQSGQVCVAWHAFRENNYDVYLRRRDAAGSWQPPVRLTEAPTIDRHPVLFARGDELWVVYENATTERYHWGRTNTRQLVVAKVTPQGLLVPRTAGTGSPLVPRCEAAAATFDETGRLWVAFLKPRLPRAGWDTFVTCLEGDRWQPAVPVGTQKGMDRTPSLALDGNRAIVAFQADDMPQTWSEVDRTPEAVSNVLLASVALELDPAPGAIATEPLKEPDAPFEPGTIRVERGEDAATPTIEYQGQALKLFYGDLHEHTDVSVCNRVGDQSVDESYQCMRDIAALDFACATDHGYNINPYLWCYLGKLARVNDDPDRFLTFLAEEWTSSFEKYSEKHPYGYYGHRNLIFADPYFPRWWNSRGGQTPASVWEELRKMNANFVHIPHQLADTGNVPTDWDFTDEAAQPVAEIFQTRGSYEYKGTPREAGRSTPKPGYFLQDAWARGIVIGVIASPDHGGGYGKACVFAPELTREAILEAIRRRHCFGTTAARIFLDVRVDEHLMGEKIAAAAGDTVEVKIRARCPAAIERIEVCRNNRFIYTNQPKGRDAELTFIDREPLQGRSYYYVRVIQEDEEIAWSSPVWFGAE